MLYYVISLVSDALSGLFLNCLTESLFFASFQRLKAASWGEFLRYWFEIGFVLEGR